MPDTLKEIISSFLMPLPIGLMIFLIGLLYLYSKKYKIAKVLLGISFLWIFITAYSPFSNAILKPLETSYPVITKDISVKYILLLGGHYESRGSEAYRLYNLIDGSKIITSGYKGVYDYPEAIRSANKFIELGVPKEDILIQVEPINTEEEAIYTKKIVGVEPFILVTAAFHMPRAMKLFKKYGLNPIAAPTNFLRKSNKPMSLPNAKTLIKSEIAFHEYLGLVWNKLKEYKKKIIDNIDE